MKTFDISVIHKNIWGPTDLPQTNISILSNKSKPELNNGSDFDRDHDLICQSCGFFMSKNVIRIGEQAICPACGQEMIDANIFSTTNLERYIEGGRLW